MSRPQVEVPPGYIEEDERPDDLVLDRLEKITGLTFPEYQKLGFEEFVDDLETRLRPENVCVDCYARLRDRHARRPFDA